MSIVGALGPEVEQAEVRESPCSVDDEAVPWSARMRRLTTAALPLNRAQPGGCLPACQSQGPRSPLFTRVKGPFSVGGTNK